MNFDKIKKVNEELDKLPTYTSKLNHWKKNYFEKYSTPEKLHEYFESKTKEELGGNTSDGLMGELRLPVTTDMLIPSIDSPNYGVPTEERIEYYNWMINFLAERRFIEIAKPYYENELKKPLGLQLLKGVLENIERIQSNAIEQLKKGEISLYSQSDITQEKLYLWYRNNYYSQIEVRAEHKTNPYVKSVCTHKYIYPYLESLLKKDTRLAKIILSKTIKYNISGLNNLLCERGYFEKSELELLNDWFNGQNPENSIFIKKPMNHFASVIASLVENKIIANSKKDCYSIIHNSFLFDGEIAEVQSIENAMKPNNSNRITEYDMVNFIDVAQFLEKS
ncbi:MAG: hypothetical protein JXR65_10120 [Bacteroidales bacterium]|nr:hypothetical protein [Bacteroidales bacterium]